MMQLEHDVEILTPDPLDATRTVSVVVRDAETLIELSRQYFERGWRVTSPAPSVFMFGPPADPPTVSVRVMP